MNFARPWPTPKTFALDHICGYCGEYGFKANNPAGPGQAHCKHYKKWFPDQMNIERTPAGMRGGECKHWQHMGQKAGQKEEGNEDQ